MFWQTAYASTISLPQASTMAVRVDHLHDFLWWISVFFLALITVGMLYFVAKYHRSKKGRETAYILGSHTLELAWTIGPLVLMLAIFAWGYKDYLAMRAVPNDAYEINVVGRQWLWNFEYTNGRKTMSELYLPKDRPIKLIITSEDVLHSFFLPNHRLKMDAVPGMYTYMSFKPILAGIHPIYCTEYCGTAHSDMLAKAYVLEQKDFDEWLQTGKSSAIAKLPNYMGHSLEKVASAAPSAASGNVQVSLPDKGRELFNAKGCFACHSVDGTRKVGPSLKSVFGKTEQFADGSSGLVDENYLRQSLMEPNAKIVKDFAPSMPTFKGLLSDEEVNALIAYIKSLK
jgi:cytochrome c oxidase subunit 2